MLLAFARRTGIFALVLVLVACGDSASAPDQTDAPDQPRDVRTVAQAMDDADDAGDVDGANMTGQQATATPGFGPAGTAAPTATGPTAAPATATAPPASPTPVPPTPTPVPASPTPAPSPTATLGGTPLPTYNADMMGIQMTPDSVGGFETMLWLADRLGIGWIKLQMRWDRMEPEPGVYSEWFYTYRLLVQTADQQGFKVLLSIAKAPGWARDSQEEDGPPRDPQMLADFLTVLLSEVRVDLYGNSYFEAIEVWNEPNLRREWNGGALNGAEYMRYFDAAYNAIRNGEGGQSITIITAGLAPTGINDGVNAVNDRTYLRQMYEAGLNNPAYQNIGIGVHPYGAWNPPDARCCQPSGQGYDDDPTWFFLDNLEATHAIMQEYNDTEHQLWPTEFGWGTYDGLALPDGSPASPPPEVPYFQYIDEWDQANYIMRAFELGQDLPYVGPMFLWNMNFSNTELVVQQDERAAYAILRNDAASDPLRPAFRLLERAPKQ
jgi:polysaccharide biosynthesis protein PslG